MGFVKHPFLALVNSRDVRKVVQQSSRGRVVPTKSIPPTDVKAHAHKAWTTACARCLPSAPPRTLVRLLISAERMHVSTGHAPDPQLVSKFAGRLMDPSVAASFIFSDSLFGCTVGNAGGYLPSHRSKSAELPSEPIILAVLSAILSPSHGQALPTSTVFDGRSLYAATSLAGIVFSNPASYSVSCTLAVAAAAAGALAPHLHLHPPQESSAYVSISSSRIPTSQSPLQPGLAAALSSLLFRYSAALKSHLKMRTPTLSGGGRVDGGALMDWRVDMLLREMDGGVAGGGVPPIVLRGPQPDEVECCDAVADAVAQCGVLAVCYAARSWAQQTQTSRGGGDFRMPLALSTVRWDEEDMDGEEVCDVSWAHRVRVGGVDMTHSFHSVLLRSLALLKGGDAAGGTDIAEGASSSPPVLDNSTSRPSPLSPPESTPHDPSSSFLSLAGLPPSVAVEASMTPTPTIARSLTKSLAGVLESTVRGVISALPPLNASACPPSPHHAPMSRYTSPNSLGFDDSLADMGGDAAREAVAYAACLCGVSAWLRTQPVGVVGPAGSVGPSKVSHNASSKALTRLLDGFGGDSFSSPLLRRTALRDGAAVGAPSKTVGRVADGQTCSAQGGGVDSARHLLQLWWGVGDDGGEGSGCGTALVELFERATSTVVRSCAAATVCADGAEEGEGVGGVADAQQALADAEQTMLAAAGVVEVVLTHGDVLSTYDGALRGGVGVFGSSDTTTSLSNRDDDGDATVLNACLWAANRLGRSLKHDTVQGPTPVGGDANVGGDAVRSVGSHAVPCVAETLRRCDAAVDAFVEGVCRAVAAANSRMSQARSSRQGEGGAASVQVSSFLDPREVGERVRGHVAGAVHRALGVVSPGDARHSHLALSGADVGAGGGTDVSGFDGDEWSSFEEGAVGESIGGGWGFDDEIDSLDGGGDVNEEGLRDNAGRAESVRSRGGAALSKEVESNSNEGGSVESESVAHTRSVRFARHLGAIVGRTVAHVELSRLSDVSPQLEIVKGVVRRVWTCGVERVLSEYAAVLRSQFSVWRLVDCEDRPVHLQPAKVAGILVYLCRIASASGAAGSPHFLDICRAIVETVDMDNLPPLTSAAVGTSLLSSTVAILTPSSCSSFHEPGQCHPRSSRGHLAADVTTVATAVGHSWDVGSALRDATLLSRAFTSPGGLLRILEAGCASTVQEAVGAVVHPLLPPRQSLALMGREGGDDVTDTSPRDLRDAVVSVDNLITTAASCFTQLSAAAIRLERIARLTNKHNARVPDDHGETSQRPPLQRGHAAVAWRGDGAALGLAGFEPVRRIRVRAFYVGDVKEGVDWWFRDASTPAVVTYRPRALTGEEWAVVGSGLDGLVELKLHKSSAVAHTSLSHPVSTPQSQSSLSLCSSTTATLTFRTAAAAAAGASILDASLPPPLSTVFECVPLPPRNGEGRERQNVGDYSCGETLELDEAEEGGEGCDEILHVDGSVTRSDGDGRGGGDRPTNPRTDDRTIGWEDFVRGAATLFVALSRCVTGGVLTSRERVAPKGSPGDTTVTASQVRSRDPTHLSARSKRNVATALSAVCTEPITGPLDASVNEHGGVFHGTSIGHLETNGGAITGKGWGDGLPFLARASEVLGVRRSPQDGTRSDQHPLHPEAESSGGAVVEAAVSHSLQPSSVGVAKNGIDPFADHFDAEEAVPLALHLSPSSTAAPELREGSQLATDPFADAEGVGVEGVDAGESTASGLDPSTHIQSLSIELTRANSSLCSDRSDASGRRSTPRGDDLGRCGLLLAAGFTESELREVVEQPRVSSAAGAAGASVDADGPHNSRAGALAEASRGGVTSVTNVGEVQSANSDVSELYKVGRCAPVWPMEVSTCVSLAVTLTCIAVGGLRFAFAALVRSAAQSRGGSEAVGHCARVAEFVLGAHDQQLHRDLGASAIASAASHSSRSGEQTKASSSADFARSAIEACATVRAQPVAQLGLLSHPPSATASVMATGGCRVPIVTLSSSGVAAVAVTHRSRIAVNDNGLSYSGDVNRLDQMVRDALLCRGILTVSAPSPSPQLKLTGGGVDLTDERCAESSFGAAVASAADSASARLRRARSLVDVSQVVTEADGSRVRTAQPSSSMGGPSAAPQDDRRHDGTPSKGLKGPRKTKKKRRAIRI